MTRLTGLRLLPILLLSCTGSAGSADLVTGTVVDIRGRPVAGVRVGTSFALAETAAGTRVQISYSDPPVLTNAAGSFSIPAAPIGYTHALVAAGNDGSLGYTIRGPAGPARIVLKQPARLRLQILKRFGHPHSFSIELVSGGFAVAYGNLPAASAEFVAPQGALQLSGVGDPESIAILESLELAPERTTPVRLDLQPTAWARNLGKPAPDFTPTDVHNLVATKELSTPRGKWVYVTFWATWCRPCVAEMPRLIDFYRTHAAQRAHFQIIAVHSPDGASFAGIQGAYRHLVQVWGESIPFPLLFDSTGATHKRWGIEVYPTTLLIDPQGRVVGAATLEDLAAKLGPVSGAAAGSRAPTIQGR